MVVPPAIGFVWMAIFGGTGLYMDLFQGTAISEAVSQDVTTAIFVLLKEFPLYTLLSVLMLVLIVIFLVTSADSAVFVLGMMTSDGDNPSNIVKVIWGVLMAGITAVLIASSGLKGLQTASLVSALPFTIILGIISIRPINHCPRREKKQKDKPSRFPCRKPSNNSWINSISKRRIFH